MKIFKDFTSENIVFWIKSILQLLIRPKRFIVEIEQKSDTDLLSQFLFYFIFYVFFFIFVNVEHSNESLIKQGMILLVNHLFVIFPVFVTLLLLCKKKKIKTAIIFIVCVFLFFTPFILFFWATFYFTENYNYKLLLNVLIIIQFFYSNYVIAFILFAKWKKKLFFLLTNYLLTNILYASFVLLNIDNYRPIGQNDLIFIEYAKLFTKFEYIDKYPAVLTYTFDKDSLYFGFALSGMDTIATNTNYKDIEDYKNTLELNVKLIEQTDFQFYRNALIGGEYRKYFNQTLSLIKQEFFHFDDFRKHGYTLNIFGLPTDTILIYTKTIEERDNLLNQRQLLFEYHNDLLRSMNKAETPLYIMNYFQFFLCNKTLGIVQQKQHQDYFVPSNFIKIE